jgi:uncharacterized protein involved in cysteine biosynthesis
MFIFKEISAGVVSYLKGCRWLLKNRSCLYLLLSPALVAFLLLLLFLGVGFFYYDKFLWNILSKYLSEIGIGGNYLFFIGSILILSIIFIAVFFYSCLINLVASPIYDYVSAVFEKQTKGDSKDHPWSLLFCLRLVFEETKKIVFISILSMVVSITPVVNLFSPVFAAFLVGWLFYDFPCARWGMSFRERVFLAFKNFWSLLGLGLFVFVPFAQFILMPLAVIGGTMLALEHTKDK